MNWFKGIEFAQPGFFWLLLIIPLMVAYYYWRNQQLQGMFSMSSTKGFASAAKNPIRIWRHYGIVLTVTGTYRPDNRTGKAAIRLKLAKRNHRRD